MVLTAGYFVKDVASVPVTSVLRLALDWAPKLVNAAPAVIAPVPPFAMAIVVPLQVPEVIVPTVFKLDKDVNVEFEVAVIFPALVAVVALPKKFGAVTSLLNVLAPANVCAPVVTIPPFVASAGARFKIPEVTIAPLEVAEVEMGPTVIAPSEGVLQVKAPDPVVVKT